MAEGKALVVIRDQLGQLLGVVIGRHRLSGSAHRERGDAVGAGRATQAQVDAARMQRLEQAERLDDLQRRVIRQHHPAGANAQPLGPAGDVLDHDLGRGTGQAGRVVMLGEPVAVVAQPVGKLGETDGSREGFA